MSNSSSDNISLIYDFNPDSPLFARVAAGEMDEGKYDEALKILEDGISKYPNYPTAFFIYAQCLTYAGKYREAEDAVVKGASVLDSDSAKEFYLAKIVEIKNKNAVVKESKRVSFLEEEEITAANSVKPKDEPPIEERLDELAAELEKAKIPPIEPQDLEPLSTKEYTEELDGKDYISFGDDEELFEEEELASETMAMILEGQGKLQEAKKIYQKLIEKEPEKAAIFELKIGEIDKKLTGSN